MRSAAVTLANAKEAGRPALIGYFPLGFPTLDDSIEACVAMCQSGVDILEVGIPYSDPVMDGVVIQEATAQALANGFKLSQAFSAIRAITERVSAPVLIMTYWNPVLQYGLERFARDAKSAGVSGLITPDLIPDEAGQWLEISDALGLERVFLATPSSSQTRIGATTDISRGFVYCVSTMGITGARQDLDSAARGVVAKVRAADEKQFAGVGIGVSTRAQVLEIGEYADAAIVGSVFVKSYQSSGLDGLRSKVKEIAGQIPQGV
jgi:tryptophan synthase alpha chain